MVEAISIPLLAALALFAALFAWDTNRCSKQTIQNYVAVIQDLRNSLAAEEGVSDNLRRQLFELDCYVSAHVKAYPAKDYNEPTPEHDDSVDALIVAATTRAFDRAVEDADHSALAEFEDVMPKKNLDPRKYKLCKGHVNPDKPWPRPEQNTMHGRIDNDSM